MLASCELSERYTGMYENFKYGKQSSTGAKVPANESWWNSRSCGTNVPRVRKFHGAKVLRLFTPRKRMFHGTKVPRERKFLDFSLLGSECSTERKFHVSESSLRGLFDTGNESAEERKVQIPSSSCGSYGGTTPVGLIVRDNFQFISPNTTSGWLHMALSKSTGNYHFLKAV